MLALDTTTFAYKKMMSQQRFVGTTFLEHIRAEIPGIVFSSL